MFKTLLAVGLIFSTPGIAKTSFDSKGSTCSFEDFMKVFVRKESGAPKINTFLVAENASRPESEYWIYWPQKRELLLVGWPATDCSSPSLFVRRRLDLRKDIAKTAAKVGSSTYLETEEWAMKTIFEASKNGYQITF